MAHQSLYRIHRPATFADVVGQEQVTKPLAEAAKSKKIGHAYLFAGSRGLGKTSVARIFASAIGCTENDLYEIDAASNNSVEDIRTLTEGVYTLPVLLTLAAGGTPAAELNDLLGKPLDAIARDKALGIVRSNSGVESAIESARSFVAMAQAECNNLPPGGATDALLAAPAVLLESVIN